jgi:hypothetical protein
MATKRLFGRYRENIVPVLVVWAVVTGIIVTMVLNDVLPWIITRSSTVFVAYHYFVGPGLLVAVGIYVARRSTRPWLVAAGTVFLLWAAMSIALFCPARGCPKPTGYQYWRNIKLAVDVSIGGPRLLVSTETGACAFQCPYKIQLIPLVIGYGSYGIGVLYSKEE